MSELISEEVIKEMRASLSNAIFLYDAFKTKYSVETRVQILRQFKSIEESINILESAFKESLQ